VVAGGAALVVSLALQIGVNYANDYSDGIRGHDAQRAGPLRLTRPGLPGHAPYSPPRGCASASPARPDSRWPRARRGGCLWSARRASRAAVFYTGGRTPYGYHGLGDVSVFVFFRPGRGRGYGIRGQLAAGRSTGSRSAARCPAGYSRSRCSSPNNLRDIPRDAETDKRTLAVRLAITAPG